MLAARIDDGTFEYVSGFSAGDLWDCVAGDSAEDAVYGADFECGDRGAVWEVQPDRQAGAACADSICGAGVYRGPAGEAGAVPGGDEDAGQRVCPDPGERAVPGVGRQDF